MNTQEKFEYLISHPLFVKAEEVTPWFADFPVEEAEKILQDWEDIEDDIKYEMNRDHYLLSSYTFDILKITIKTAKDMKIVGDKVKLLVEESDDLLDYIRTHFT